MHRGEDKREKRRRIFSDDPRPGVVLSLDTSRQAYPLHLYKEASAFSGTCAVVGDDSLHQTGRSESEATADDCIRLKCELDVHIAADEIKIGESGAATVPTKVVHGSGSCVGDVLTTVKTSDSSGQAGCSPFATASHDNAPDPCERERSPLLRASTPPPGDNGSSTIERLSCVDSSEEKSAGDDKLIGRDGDRGPPPSPFRDEESSAAARSNGSDLLAGISAAPGTARPELQALPCKKTSPAPAASLIASFLKHGLPSGQHEEGAHYPSGPSVGYSQRQQGRHCAPGPPSPRVRETRSSVPVVPLASLVVGPPVQSPRDSSEEVGGSGTVAKARHSKVEKVAETVSRQTATDNIAVSEPHAMTGASRFFNDEWPRRLKERRRIIRFPRRSEPDGKRIVYWMRGNYRVRDNMALSAAMWLSVKLQMPLQVLAFVDVAFGRLQRSSTSPVIRSTDDSWARKGSVPIKAAVEASALCEVKKALQALSIPLVAVACAEGDIPATLAVWCGSSAGRHLPESHPSELTVAPADGMSAEEGAHIVIVDEAYHPRQLRLVDRAREKLPGVALYAVDSSSVCPVNNFRRRKATLPVLPSSPATSSPTTRSPSNSYHSTSSPATSCHRTPISAASPLTTSSCTALPPSRAAVRQNEYDASKNYFRVAQESVLPIVIEELIPEERHPLDIGRQRSVFDCASGAVLPKRFEDALHSEANTLSVVRWSLLRNVSKSHFPAVEETIDVDAMHPETDVISLHGGGERVAEASLQLTLKMADKAPHTHLPSEADGGGFGGCLLHLLRLGSISSLRVAQAIAHAGATGAKASNLSLLPKGLALLLDALLEREHAMYRTLSYYGEQEGRHRSSGDSASPDVRVRRDRPWRATEWLGMVPASAWAAMQKHRGNSRKYSTGEIVSAGGTVPSSVEDTLFSAMQLRLTRKARLHPMLVPYWAKAIIEMMLIPSQAMTLVIDLADGLCLGGGYAGDIITDVLTRAVDAFSDTFHARPDSATPPYTDLASAARSNAENRGLPDALLATRAGLTTAFGGEEALASFASPAASPSSAHFMSPEQCSRSRSPAAEFDGE